MESLLANEKLVLFMLCVFPGLVSMHVYRLCIAARSIEWTTAILEGLFYSVVNFALCFPILVWISYGDNIRLHPVWFGLAGVFVLLIGPVLWPVIWVKVLRSSWMENLQLPYPTAWDAFFDRRTFCFILVHLKDERLIGGYFGPGSYASSFPRDGDLYISAVYTVDEEGRFGDPVDNTKGILIRKDDYAYIEFFDVPPPIPESTDEH